MVEGCDVVAVAVSFGNDCVIAVFVDAIENFRAAGTTNAILDMFQNFFDILVVIVDGRGLVAADIIHVDAVVVDALIIDINAHVVEVVNVCVDNAGDENVFAINMLLDIAVDLIVTVAVLVVELIVAFAIFMFDVVVV